MLKNFSLMKRKDGMAFEEFRKWALSEHVRARREDSRACSTTG